MKNEYKTFQRKVFLSTMSVFIAAFSLPLASNAGNLTPIADPAATSFTLSDIWNRLTSNSEATEADHNLSTSSAPTSTFKTLTQIYEAVPTIVADTVKLGTSYLGIDGTLTPDGGTATAADIFTGKTAHLTSDWDLDTGTLSLACAISTFDGTVNKVSDDYDGSGDGTNRWCITDSGDAAAGEILSSKIAWVDGQAITGTMTNIGQQTFTPSTSSQSITQGYHDGTGYVEGDADLVSTNIKSGASIFGVNGDSNVVDTSSGDVDASKILSGYKAWTDGSEITGNITTQNLSADSETLSAGYYEATTLSTVDSDLASANIKSGETIFGVNGDSNVVDTSSGDAVATELLVGKVCYVDGSQVTGTMTNIGQQTFTPSTSSQSITQGYHDGTGYVEGDADLISANIKSGETIFGVNGDSNVVDTSSGDVDASKILSGYKAWSDGSEITGNITTQNLSADSETVSAGYYEATTLSTVDSDLASANIKSGETIFGVNGTLDVLDYGDDDASQVLTTASSAGTYDVSSLSEDTVKKGTSFGVSDTGTYSGYGGTGWQANGSGDGSTALSEANCESASGWEWFEDANGDGDTNDPGDGICVRTSTVNSDSWNGAEQVTPNNLADTTATGGTADSVTASGASWSSDAYENHIVKIISGTASGCWGRVKTNTSDTITVYGSWLSSAYASGCGTPDNTSHFQVFDDWGQYDNSFIGDYACEGNFPSGTVVHGSYPSSGTMALATADCYDGKRDLLPEETDRAVISGTATGATSTTVTDSNLNLDTNVWIGQKVLVTSGTGADSYGFIESNTSTQITVTDWLGGDDPDTSSEFSIIYIVPHASYTVDADIDGDDNDPKANNGPLMAEDLNNWKGTRLPSASDFFGFCGYKDGGSDYESSGNSSSADRTYGNYGGQVGRTDEFLDLANSGNWEWLSEQHYSYSARVAGSNACSYFNYGNVYSGNRFRSVFRP